MEKIYYTCACCGATFWKFKVLGNAGESAKCPYCGGVAHRNPLQEVVDDLNSRIGI